MKAAITTLRRSRSNDSYTEGVYVESDDEYTFVGIRWGTQRHGVGMTPAVTRKLIKALNKALKEFV